MNQHFQKLLNYFLELYLKNEEQLVVFPKALILTLRIQQSLLSLSYIYGTSVYSYVTLLNQFARPQLYLPQFDAFQYIILILSILYILNLFSIIPHTKYIGVFGQLLRSSILNFIFEYTTGSIKIFTHSFLIFISFTETLILQGTLNASTINFQNTRFTLLDLILSILNYIIMIIFSYYNVKETMVILALGINFLRALNQILYSPQKNIITKSILLTINLYTLFLGIMKAFSLKDYFQGEIVLIPLLFKVTYDHYQKELKQTIKENKNQQCSMINALMFLDNIQDLKNLNIIKPQSAKDRIMYSSILMLQDQNYEAFIELNSIKASELNILEKFKRRVILKQCINKIDCKIQVESNSQQKVALAVASLMASEESNLLIRNDILNILKEKMQCQLLLLQNQTINHYQNYINYVERTLALQKKLEKQYREFPCDKTQSILGFFYVEVINNYLAANQLFSIIALSDEKIKRVGTYQDIFSNRMIYIVSNFSQTLVIKRCSNDAQQFLKKSIDQLQGKSINMMIPQGISQNHDKFVLNFLQTGQAKFMRKISHNYFYDEYNDCMKLIEFAFDVNLLNDFSFISFLQPANNQPMALIVDSSLKISCISEGLIIELGSKIAIRNYIGVSIKKVLPDFPLVICGTQMIENVEAHFTKFHEELQVSTGSAFATILITSYSAQAYNYKGQNLYYVITFDFFKKPQQILQPSISNLSPTLSPRKDDQDGEFYNQINDESYVKIPYNEHSSQKRNTNSFYQIKLQVKDENQEKVDQYELKLFSQLENTNLISPCKQKEQLLSQQQKYFVKEKSNRFLLRGSVYEKHEIERYSNEKEMPFQDDCSSQISSLQGARRSKYYKKYEIFQKINETNPLSKNHKLFISMVLFCIFSQLIIQIIQLITMNSNLLSLASDVDLLQIKNFVFQPLETFLVTRWTIVNYNLMRDQKTINMTQYAQLIQFPRSNLNIGYDSLDYNLKQVFNRPELQNFLENTYLEIYVYVKTNQGEIYNISLRNSINILINYQFTFKMAYILDGAAVADSPYVYYQYRNYLPIKEQFSNLNELVLVDTVSRANNILFSVKILFIISLAFLFFFLILIFQYFFRISRNINKYYSQMQNISASSIELDLQRTKYISDKISKDQNNLFKFTFSLNDKEKWLESINEKQIQIRRINQKLYTVNFQDIYYYFFILGITILIAGNAALTFFEGHQYLVKYPATAQFYKAVSDVGTDLPTMYAQRDVLYGRSNFPFYSSIDIENILNEISASLNRTKIFLNQDQDFSKYLVSKDFEDYYYQIQVGNLCDFLPDDLKAKSQTLCPQVMSQNMQRGLKSVLIYSTNFIQLDMAVNQFLIRTQPSYLELEGAFLVSNLIKLINDNFNIDLAKQTSEQIQSINIHNILILIFLFIISFFTITMVKQKLKFKYKIIQRLLYLLPVKSLFLDDLFERNIRQLLQQN